MRRAALLDRDGTLVVERDGFLTRPDEIELIDGAAAAIRRLNDAGLAVIVISNQSAVARGLITERDLLEIHRRLADDLATRGARLDAIYYCPHHPEGDVALYRGACDCRKPGDLMVRRAIAEHRLDARQSFLIGDDLRDVQATRHVGVQPILVRTGKGTAREAAARGELGDALVVVDDLAAAVDAILRS